MADLIDRAAANAALEKLDELMRHRAETEDKEFVKVQVGITLARCEIDAIPTVDAAPVVRCKDCIEGDYPEEECGVMMYLCPMAGKRVRADFYCADGTRRMDADAPERADHFVDVTEKVRKE